MLAGFLGETLNHFSKMNEPKITVIADYDGIFEARVMSALKLVQDTHGLEIPYKEIKINSGPYRMYCFKYEGKGETLELDFYSANRTLGFQHTIQDIATALTSTPAILSSEEIKTITERLAAAGIRKDTTPVADSSPNSLLFVASENNLFLQCCLMINYKENGRFNGFIGGCQFDKKDPLAPSKNENYFGFDFATVENIIYVVKICIERAKSGSNEGEKETICFCDVCQQS